MRGWIAVSRKLLDPGHDLFGDDEPVCKAMAWIDLIGCAEWRRDGDLDRGCFQHATEYLRRRWNWPSKSKVYRFLKALERDERIEKVRSGSPNESSVWRIVKYDQYQFDPERGLERAPERGLERGDTGDVGENDVERNAEQNAERNAVWNGDKQERNNKGEQETLFTGDAGDQFPHPNDLPKNSAGNLVYPREYEVFWQAYPDRRGSNSKKGGYRKWRQTVLDGVRPDRLYEAVLNYRSYLESEGKVGTPYVKQAKTFLGPDEHWRQAWDDQPASESDPNRQMREDFRRRVELLDRVE